jgi:hypothetical protein
MSEPRSFGFDLDNTLIDYGPSVIEFCKNRQYPEFKSIQELKLFLRETLKDDNYWQEAQSYLYLEGLNFAKPANGSIEFIDSLSNAGITPIIISHKTRRTQIRFGGLDLRIAALDWLETSDFRGYFDASKDIHFAETRVEKIKEITNRQLSWFIDDLIEVLEDPCFPIETIRYLFGVKKFKNADITPVRDFLTLKKIWKP